jgi:hypothetical protein
LIEPLDSILPFSLTAFTEFLGNNTFVTGGVKMQKSGGFKMLFCGGEYSAAPDVFSRCGRLFSRQV